MQRMESKTKFYKRYWHIRARCTFKWDKDFSKYGAKGIKFLWKDFDEFKEDMYSSYLRHVKKHGDKNTTIDRIDSTGNYCKENCRWATTKIQSRNKKVNRYLTYKGKTLIVADWADFLGCHRNVLLYRIKNNWTTKQIIETPISHSNKINTNAK